MRYERALQIDEDDELHRPAPSVLSGSAIRLLALAVLAQAVEEARFLIRFGKSRRDFSIGPCHNPFDWIASSYCEPWCDAAGVNASALRRRVAEIQTGKAA